MIKSSFLLHDTNINQATVISVAPCSIEKWRASNSETKTNFLKNASNFVLTRENNIHNVTYVGVHISAQLTEDEILEVMELVMDVNFRSSDLPNYTGLLF